SRQFGQQILQRVGPACGNADGDDLGGLAARARSYLGRPGALRNFRNGRAPHFAFRRSLDLHDQVLADFLHVDRTCGARLGDKIESPQRQRFERGGSTFCAQRAHDNHRHLRFAHDLAEHFHSVHARHLQIQRDHVWLEVFDFFEPKRSVHSCAYNLDVAVPRQNLRNQFAHQSRIIHHQNPDPRTHAVAPIVTCARPSLATTLAMLRISTTVPSPRMEAPLTRSVATRWSSRALITSSSSPTSWSTTSPNLRSPSAVTTTNILFASLDSCVSPCRCTSESTSSRSWITS